LARVFFCLNFVLSYSSAVTNSSGTNLHERSESEGRASWMGRVERTPPGFDTKAPYPAGYWAFFIGKPLTVRKFIYSRTGIFLPAAVGQLPDDE
jgi:hypothetical protein